MRLAGISGEAYRLIIDAEQGVVIFGARHFGNFEEAQARVADAVRHHGRLGRVNSVRLQHGTPVERPGASPPEAQACEPSAETEHRWTTEKRWDREVVLRILTQAGIEAAEPPAPRPIPPPTPRPPRIPPRRTPRPAVSLHKPALWHVAATAALVTVAMITALLVQTGGQPLAILAALQEPRATIKHELPFDARTSFGPRAETLEPAPESSAGPTPPASEPDR